MGPAYTLNGLFASHKKVEIMFYSRTVQERAASSGKPEDWRDYQDHRNQKNRSVVQDETEWQKKKLSSTNNPSDMWKAAKSMLGWSSGRPPTQLYHLGAYFSGNSISYSRRH